MIIYLGKVKDCVGNVIEVLTTSKKVSEDFIESEAVEMDIVHQDGENFKCKEIVFRDSFFRNRHYATLAGDLDTQYEAYDLLTEEEFNAEYKG